MNFSKFQNIVRRYLWLLILATVIASLTTFFVLKSQPVVFEATSHLLVGPNLDSASPDLNSLKIGGQLIQTYAELVDTRPFLESVNSKLDQKMDLEVLGQMIETRRNTDTRILTIIVQDEDPKQAIAIAQAASLSLLEMSPAGDNSATLLRAQMSEQSHQLEQIASNAEKSIEQLEAQLVALGNVQAQSPETAQITLDQKTLIVAQLADERARLSDALRTLATLYNILLDTDTNQLQIIEPARAAFPVNQDLPLRVLASALAGLLLAIIIISAIEYFDDTIRIPEELSKAAKAPLLSVIDRHSHLRGSGLERVIAFTQPKSRAANGYRNAVAKLLQAIGMSKPYSILLSGVRPEAAEEAAVSAANLAVTFAHAGRRVIVVDTQSHDPFFARIFKVGDKEQAADVQATSAKAQLVQIKDVPNIRLLPVGAIVENETDAAQQSTNIARLLKEIGKEADVVMFSTPMISWFDESLSVASEVNAILLLARQGEARNGAIEEVVDTLAARELRLAGVIFDNNPSPFVFIPNLKKSKQEGVLKEATSLIRS